MLGEGIDMYETEIEKLKQELADADADCDRWKEKFKNAKTESEKLRELCSMMFNPENQPPQWDHADAWRMYQEIIGDET